MSRLSRLSSTAQYRASSLPLVVTRNFSQAPQAPNCNRYFTLLYQCKSPHFSLLNFIQTEGFSSKPNRSSSKIVLEQARLSEMMRGMGFREETVKKLFEELPLAVLKDSAGFRKKIDFLKYIGLSSREIDQILFSCSEFLELSFEGRLKPLLDELHKMNFSHAEIRAAIHENPKPFLRLVPGELSRCIELLDSLRCRHPIKERILNMGYLRASINVKLRIECLHKHGLILRDAFKVLYVEPRAILYDLADIEEKIEFLLQKMRFCIEHLVECPEYLGVNLDKQIIPRYNVFEYLRSVNGLGDEVWMKHYVKLSRMKFYNMFVKPYPECEKIFNGFRKEKIARPHHPVGMWKLFKPQKFPESDKDVRNMKKFVKTSNLC